MSASVVTLDDRARLGAVAALVVMPFLSEAKGCGCGDACCAPAATPSESATIASGAGR